MAKTYPLVYVVRYNTPDGIPTITKYRFNGQAKNGIKVTVKGVVKYVPGKGKAILFGEEEARAIAAAWCVEKLIEIRVLGDKVAKACNPDTYTVANA